MTIKTILVPVRGDGKGDNVLNCSIALARRFNAHLRVVHSRPNPEDMLPFGVLLTDGMRKTILESASANSTDEEGRLKGLFDKFCVDHDLKIIDTPPAPEGSMSASWHEITGKQAHVVAVQGRLTDIIAVSQPEPDTQLGTNTLEAALLETGKLVLMIPDGSFDTVGDAISVAWNGSAESARAVTMAMPLLVAASKVTVLSADDESSNEFSANELVEQLAWHGIKAEAKTFKAHGSGLGDALIAAAKGSGSDLLLMGGYGHSRRRELIMGGVTKNIIDNADMPVLLAH